ncbi:MAG: T9SS type A sorting domain-containing protein [bacterium]
MNRRNLLKSLGAVGLGSVLPLKKALSAEEKVRIRQSASTCFLTPQETEGPYYFNANLVRQDIRQDLTTSVVKTGLPLNMVITVIDFDCNPIPNVLVDIWHCDKDGIYSGYAGQPGGVSTVGQNFLRGIQMTDTNGQCSFVSIYPGWYPSRVTHVHFKVRLTSTTYVTSQFAFPDSSNTAVYGTPLYVAKGQNSLTNATDSIFGSANPENQVMAVTSNAATGGYDGTFTIGILAPTKVGEAEDAPEGFSLQQNYPNPFNPTTTIAYHSPVGSEVKLVVHDVHGRKVATLVDTKQAAGTYQITFDASALSSGFYYYTLTAGSFVRTKEMLLIR